MKILNSQKIAFIYNNQKVTYNTFLKLIDYYSDILNVTKDDKVAIIMENRPEWLACFYAIWNKNGVNVPIDYNASKEELTKVINEIKPKIIFYSNFTSKIVKELVKDPSIELINIDNQKVTFKENIEDKDFSFDMEKASLIAYTAGTEDKPIAVKLSKKNLFFDLEVFSNEIKEETFYTYLPFYNIIALQFIVIKALHTNSTIFIDNTTIPFEILSNIRNNKITALIANPIFYKYLHKKLIKNIKKSFLNRFRFNLSKILGINLLNIKNELLGENSKFLFSVSSHLDYKIQKELQDANIFVLTTYGFTESGSLISYNLPKYNKIGSSGKIVPGVEIKEKDGEILIKGENIALGYFNNIEEEKHKFIDGWFHTGDLGHLEGDSLYIYGRKSELIVLDNGKTIWPNEIEDKIHNLSSVIKEVSIIEYEDKLAAVIVPDLEETAHRKINNIEYYIRDIISDKYNIDAADDMKISDIKILNEDIPRSSFSRIKRFKLKNLILTKKIKRLKVEEPTSIEYKMIKDYFINNFSKKPYPDAHIEIDLALDSLEKVDLLFYIKQTFGIEIDNETFAQNSKFIDFVNYIEKNKEKVDESKVDWNKILNDPIDYSVPNEKLSIEAKIFNFLFRSYFKLEIEGKVIKGPYILAGNHLSMLDWYAIWNALPNDEKAKTFCLAKDKLLKSRIASYLSYKMNVIKFNIEVEREMKESLQKLSKILKEGKNVAIFPEGTRARDNSLKKFKKSFAILSKENNVPVIPTVLKGTFELLGPGKIFPKPGKITIRFLEPIYPENKTYDQIVDETYNAIKKEL